MRKIILTVALAACLMAAGTGRGEGVALDQVPETVLKSAAAAAGSVKKWTSADRGKATDGTEAYQLLGKNTAGKLVVFRAKNDGTVIEVFVDVDLSDVPAAVRKALAEKYPGFKPEFASSVGLTDDPEKALGYRFEGTDAGGRERTVLIAVPKQSDTGAKPGAPAGDRKALQGAWKVVSGTKGGAKFAVGGSLVIDGTTFSLSDGDGFTLFSGELTLGPGASPKEFDVRGSGIPDVFFLDFHASGIYQLKGGKLSLSSFFKGPEFGGSAYAFAQLGIKNVICPRATNTPADAKLYPDMVRIDLELERVEK